MTITISNNYAIVDNRLAHLPCNAAVFGYGDKSKCSACAALADDEAKKANFIGFEVVNLAEIDFSDLRTYSDYLPKETLQKFAIYCAESVLPLFEAKYPDDNRPREAIAAAKAYMAGSITLKELENKRRAAADAAAADAADAADAYAAYAAYAAYSAAYAANAANAAAYAATNAAAADAADAAIRVFWRTQVNAL